MAIIRMEIHLDKCVDSKKDIKCPYATERLTKGFGYAVDYMCSLMHDKVTSSYVEWNRDVNPVPDWCPLMVK